MKDKWYSTPEHMRRRKALKVTVSDESRLLLTKLAAHRQMSVSRFVEWLLMSFLMSDK